MKILFTALRIAHPPKNGPELRIENSLIGLGKVSELHVLSQCSYTSIGGEKADTFFKAHCHYFEYLPSVRSTPISFFIDFCINSIHSLLGPKIGNALVLLLKTDRDAKYIAKYAQKNGIEVVWFGYGNMSYALMKRIKILAPSLKLVCDTDSVYSRFILRELPYVTDEKRKHTIMESGRSKELEEADWVTWCDITTAVSETDAQYYRDISVEPGRIKLFSNVINLDSYKQSHIAPNGLKHPNLYLAGSFWPNSPMEQASRWVIGKILPLLKPRYPTIHLYIIGNNAKAILSDITEPSATVVGDVDSVLPFLTNADVALVPLKYESGTRFKILEAAACSVPIVSTSLGAEGIPVSDKENILIADTEDEFAEAICKILDDAEYGKKIASNCYELIRKRYCIDSLMYEAEEIMESLQIEK